MPYKCRVGVDVGGTFTDAVLYSPGFDHLVTAKVPTSLPDPSLGIVESVQEVCARAGVQIAEIEAFLHGTTIAANALLEHKGVRTGMITSLGFRDIVHIGRHQRPQNYSVMQEIPWQNHTLVPRRYRRVVSERISGAGEVLVPLDDAELLDAAEELVRLGVRSIVIAFLNSYRNPVHELHAQELVEHAFPDLFVTASSEVVAQFREFERFTTAAINGFVGPLVRDYLRNVVNGLKEQGLGSPVRLMMSNGGATTPEDAARAPVTLLMSGPAAGVLGGRWAGEAAGGVPAITFDMGGTSADIGIVKTSGISEASARDTWVAGFPVLIPMLDVLSVGAGGGSIAFLDAGGALQVGPRSAGAVPGPACYSKGGREPTVTDAHAVLGRLDPERRLGGSLAIDVAAAHEAISSVSGRLGLAIADMAEGIIRIANHNMAAAIRAQTIQRGIDPRVMTLIAFGGAGPLHAAELAEILGVGRVLIPPAPGNTSALGLLTTSLSYFAVATVFENAASCDAEGLAAVLGQQRARLIGQLKQSGVDESEATFTASMDCRYFGQGYELRIPVAEAQITVESLGRLVGDFHAAHLREYGHHFPADPVEFVNLRAVASGPRPEMTLATARATSAPEPPATHAGSAWFRDGDRLLESAVTYVDRASLAREQMLKGPVIICQDDTTLVVPPGWICQPHPSGSLTLLKGAGR